MHKATRVNIASFESNFALTMTLIFSPLALVSIAGFIDHRAFADSFVLLELTNIEIAVGIRLLSMSLFFVHDHFTFVAFSLLGYDFSKAMQSACFPKAMVYLTCAKYFQTLLVKLALMELPVTKGAIHEDVNSLPLRLMIAIHLTRVVRTLVHLFLLDKLSFLADPHVNATAANFPNNITLLLSLLQTLDHFRIFLQEAFFNVGFACPKDPV